MSHRIHPFCSDVILVRFVSSFFWSRAFVGINNTSVFCLAFPNTAVGFSTALYQYFARHCCWHRNFQLSTSGFRRELEFFIVWFNKEYSSQLPGIVELWFLDSPSLFCLLFLLHRTHASTYLATHRLGERLFVFLVSILTDHVYPSGGLSFSRTNLVKPVHASDNSFLHPRSSNLHYSSPTIHQVMYMLFW